MARIAFILPAMLIAVSPQPVLAQPQQAASPQAAANPEPWPVNLGGTLKTPWDLKFSAELEARRRAYQLFGYIPCSTCEGGKQDDGSPGRHLPNYMDSNPEGKLITRMTVGQSWSWKGIQTAGKFTILSEGPVGPFQCRQIRWELKRGKESATRPSLFCKYNGVFVRAF